MVNRSGVQRVLPVPLSGEERDGLHRSARTVRAVPDKLALGFRALRILATWRVFPERIRRPLE